jgi:Tfp pilus assembly protein PilO
MSRSIPTISVILLIILLFGGYFFWWPRYREFRQQKAVLAEKIKALEEKNSYYSRLIKIDKELAVYRAEIDKIDSALPKEVSLPVIFDYLKRISAKQGLILDRVDFSGTGRLSSKYKRLTEKGNSKETGVVKIAFSASLTGPYPAFKKFLSELYQSAKLIEVKSLNFSSPTEGNLFEFDLELETYALPKTETVNNPEKNIP